MMIAFIEYYKCTSPYREINYKVVEIRHVHKQTTTKEIETKQKGKIKTRNKTRINKKKT